MSESATALSQKTVGKTASNQNASNQHGFGIIELFQLSDNDWQAKYRDNEGTYSIRIITKEKRISHFICSCKSEYYPCNHIPIVEAAILEQITISEKHKKQNWPEFEENLKKIPVEKLREFIINEAKANTKVYNTAIHGFFNEEQVIRENKYVEILQLKERKNINVLAQWLDTALNHVRNEQYDKAIQYCKAIIEEYFQWQLNAGDEVSIIFPSEFISFLFNIMGTAAQNINNKEALLNYCIAEIKKNKMAGFDSFFHNNFHKLIENLALSVNPEAFISLQNELLYSIKDTASHEARCILERKINFYKNQGQEGKAWQIIEKNTQIEAFSLKVVENKIGSHDIAGAKVLINEFIERQSKDPNSYINSIWYQLLLDIYHEENQFELERLKAYEEHKKKRASRR